MVYSIDRSNAVVPVLLFVALWFILRGDLFYVLPCVILFSVLLALRLPRLGKRELILVLFVRLFDLRLFGFVCVLFLLVSKAGFKALLQLANTLGPNAILNTEIQKNSVRIKAPNSVDASKRKKKKIKLITIINKDEYSWLILLYARVNENQ